MGFRYKPAIKIISIVVLVFFTWTFGGGVEVAYAVKDSDNLQVASSKSKELRPEEKLQKAIGDITNTIEDVGKIGRLEDEKKGKLKTKKTEIEGLDVEIKKQFKETEEKIKDLPEVIKQRHRDFVKKYENNLNELKVNLNAIGKAATKAKADAAIEKTKTHLEKVKPPKKHIPLDPNKLPHRNPEIKNYPIEEKQPAKSNKANSTYGKPILIASIGSLAGLLSTAVVQTVNIPTPDDLSATIEVQFTPEITAKAEELQHNPVKIYEYIRNNFEFEPYYGSLKGAQQTLLEKAGNDFDQASLLIALLRASNIPARYVYGTVEIPMEDIKSWLGIDDTNMALTALASSGIPLTAITSGGTVVAARLEHVWCQAFVPYVQSRGSLEGLGDTWIDIDPSFKNVNKKLSQNINPPVFDQSQYLLTVKQNDPVVVHESDIQLYLDTALPNSITDAVKIQKEIEAHWFEFLLGTLPYDIIVSTTFAAIPDSYQYKITFSVTDEETDLFGTPLIYTTMTPELAGKRISLSYGPATSADNNLINKYGGLYNVPAYLLQLKPEIRLNGEIKASGSAIGFGKSQYFRINFKMPYGKSDSVENIVNTGGYYVPVMNLQTIPEHQVLVRTDNFRKLDAILQSGGTVPLDDYAGEILNLTGLAYFQKLNSATKNAEQILKVVDVKEMSEAIVSIDVSVDYVFSTPIKVTLSSLGIDVDRNIHLPIPIAGDLNRKKEFMILNGMTSSFYEHKIFEDIFTTESISAIKIIQIANERGIPVYTLNSGNISTYINSLQVSTEVKTDVINAINAGKEVMIPKQEIQINDWFGIGYIVTNPQTGSAAYMISGGLAGGSTTLTSMAVALAQMLSYHLSVIAIAEVIDSILSPHTVTFPGEDNAEGTKDDKTYPIIDLIKLPKAERDNYYDPHPDVGYNGVIKIDETNASDFLSYFVTLKGFQSGDEKPYLRVTPSIVWAIEHIAYVLDAVEDNSVPFSYSRPRKGVEITSGYRTKSRNASEGGKDKSFHMDGVAADIKVYVRNRLTGEILYAGDGLKQAAEMIISNNGGVGIYNTRVHIDVRGSRARWRK